MQVKYRCSAALDPGEVIRPHFAGDEVTYYVDCAEGGADIAAALERVVVPFVLTQWMCPDGCRTIRAVATDLLPAGLGASVLVGDGEAVVLLDQAALGCQLAGALDDLLSAWASEAWVYVGDLRSVP